MDPEARFQEPDIKAGYYYVSCRRDDGKTLFLAGPFRDDHAAALALVDQCSMIAEQYDQFAFWYSYGTARTAHDYDRPGTFNERLGL
jgi:hypothetical protein